MKSPVLCAFEILDSVIRNNAYSNLAIDGAVRDFSKSERALISQLVYGVVERRLTLDFLISQHLEKRTKPKVKIILYIGAYQLYFMNSVPPHAAVNETVKLCDETGCGFYKGLVNAVLHKIDNNRIDIASLESPEVKYSCPKELINMWSKQYSPEKCGEILEAINGKPPVFAVPNSLFVTADELIYELALEGVESEKAGEIVKITSSFSLTESISFKRGLFHIEDLSSYICAKKLEAKENETVLDICSAPGGKAFTIAEGMNNKGTLFAFDLYEHRVKLIESGAERLGITNIKASVNNAEEFSESIPLADRILCDVPCSGFGVIRRKPEIRYKELDSVKELPALQLKILETSAGYLKKGGRIIYSTCTLNKKENEKVVSAFLDKNEGFALSQIQTIIPSEDGGDGFFFAVMEKIND